MDEVTKVIEMSIHLDKDLGTTMIGSHETSVKIQVEMLCKHARTMCMMYQGTKEAKYLKQARIDLHNAKSLLRGGFIRPLGVFFKEVA